MKRMRRVDGWATSGKRLVGALAFAVLAGCSTKEPSTMQKQPWGKTPDGTDVTLYTLANGKGMEAAITNYGGIVVSLIVPDRHGKPGDVVLGYDSLAQYVASNPYFGALIGRYGNRIGCWRPHCPGCGKNDKVERNGWNPAGPRRVMDADECIWVWGRRFKCDHCGSARAGSGASAGTSGAAPSAAGFPAAPPAQDAPRRPFRGNFMSYDLTVMQTVRH